MSSEFTNQYQRFFNWGLLETQGAQLALVTTTIPNILWQISRH